MKKILLLTTCLLSGLVAADAPGGPKIEEGLAGGKYFQFSHPVTNTMNPDTGRSFLEEPTREFCNTLYKGASNLEQPVPSALLEALATDSTAAYSVSSILGDSTEQECAALFNSLNVLAEDIRKTHGAQIAILAKALRNLARKSSGLYLHNTTDGKSRR